MAEFYCSKCNSRFEVDWELLWNIQVCTHGYVRHHLNNTFISCEKCGEIFSNEESVQITKPVNINSADELPF